MTIAQTHYIYKELFLNLKVLEGKPRRSNGHIRNMLNVSVKLKGYISLPEKHIIIPEVAMENAFKLFFIIRASEKTKTFSNKFFFRVL